MQMLRGQEREGCIVYKYKYMYAQHKTPTRASKSNVEMVGQSQQRTWGDSDRSNGCHTRIVGESRVQPDTSVPTYWAVRRRHAGTNTASSGITEAG